MNQSKWSKPIALTPESAPEHARVARFSSIVTNGTSTFVLGGNIPDLDRPRGADGLLTAFELGVQSLGRPKGSFLFAYPRASIDRDGRLRATWAEPASGDRVGSASGLLMQLSEIWTSTSLGGTRWSTPIQLYAGDPLQWDKWMLDQFTHDDGTTTVAAVGWRIGSPILLIRLGRAGEPLVRVHGGTRPLRSRALENLLPTLRSRMISTR